MNRFLLEELPPDRKNIENTEELVKSQIGLIIIHIQVGA